MNSAPDCPRLDLSVVICSADRSGSLAETLSRLAACRRDGLAVEVVVVDNSADGSNREVVRAAAERMTLRYLAEPRPGKSRALNRALDAGGLGAVTAVLDDDMSPEEGWIEGVIGVTRRWPEHAVFTGPGRIEWPAGDRPGWTDLPSFHGWAFSVLEYRGEDERPLQPGVWPSGNHFWVRTSALAGRRFPETWNGEALLMLSLIDAGRPAVVTPAAVAGHRVQRALFDERELLARALRTGRNVAVNRLPQRRTVASARLLDRHPVFARLLWSVNVAKWSARSVLARLRRDPARRFEARCLAALNLGKNLERLRIAGAVRAGWCREESGGLNAPPPGGRSLS